MSQTEIEQVRSFTRSVTQRVGVLEASYLDRGRPLGASRLVWEIGADGCDVRALRARLGLDAGYVSRLLRSLEADGLVSVEVGAPDARVRRARLTAAGLAERQALDDGADAVAASLLDGLGARQRDRLVDAMAEVERLLRASAIRIAPVDPAEPAARSCLERYYAELDARFEGGFDPARSIVTGPDQLTPPNGVFLVATLGDEPVACGGLLLADGESMIKRMWVAPAVRGLGLARRLLGELEALAVAHGRTRIRLDTNRALAEAIALYTSAGYREVPRFSDEVFAHHWFEKPLPAAAG